MFGKDPSQVVDTLVTGYILISANMCNPQGDIDTENRPRVTPLGLGLITAPGIKRKIRDTVSLVHSLSMHVVRRGCLFNETVSAVAKHLGQEQADALSKTAKEEEAETDGVLTCPEGVDLKEAMGSSKKKGKSKGKTKTDWPAEIEACEREYFDDRAFGKVYTKPINQGVTGPVQFSHFQSLSPINVLDLSIGCVAVATPEERKDKTQTIGRLSIVQYGLYGGSFVCSPHYARKTKFTWGDLEKLVGVLPLMWDLNTSVARGPGGCVHEKGFFFLHESPYGSYPIPKLNAMVTPTLIAGRQPTSIKDYEFGPFELPPSVKLIEV